MKHNKKILMGVVAGMALAAVATGGVASFAWYTSTAATKATVAAATYGVGSTSTEVTLDNITVVIVLQQKGADVQLSHVVTAAEVEGGLKYSNNTSAAANDVMYGAMKNGAELYTAKWDGDNSAHRLIGEYEVDMTAGTGTRITTELTAGQKAAIKDKHFDAVLSTEGNAKILSVTSLTPAMADAVAEASTPTVRITFNAAGDGIASATLSNPYFAIRATSITALEDAHTTDKIKVDASPTGGYTLSA